MTPVWRSSLLVLAACRVSASAEHRSARVTFYVAERGNDRWSGTRADVSPDGRDGPFATLDRARDAIRALHPRPPGVEVVVRGGHYARTTPFVLEAEDSGTRDAPIVYRAAAGEGVTITGGHVLSFTAIANDERLPIEARGHVREASIADVPQLDFRSGAVQLFADDAPMTLARWPDEGFAHVTSVSGTSPVTIEVGERASRWAGERDVWVHGYWYWDWADERERVASIDATHHALVLEPPLHQYGYRANQRFYAYNVLAELDRPGEWYLDRERQRILFWPPAETHEAAIAVANTLVEIHGASDVTFRDLTFEIARRDAITIDRGTRDEIVHCTVRDVGGWGITIEGGAGDGVADSELDAIGLGGISMRGGDRAALTAGDHYATGNTIHAYATWKRAQKPAIALFGVGLRAARNDIYDAPNQAIAFDGNDHIIEANDIHDVCTETSDAGAIYGMRDWTMRGTEIRNNVIHDVKGADGQHAAGVYLDDMLSGTNVTGNVLDNVAIGVLIGGGRDNTISHNIFVSTGVPVLADARGLGWAANSIERDMMPRLRAMPVHSPRWVARYPALSHLLDDAPGAPRGNALLGNIESACGSDDIYPEVKPLLRSEHNVVLP